MKHIGLFEGIGGFSLAAMWMGWETVAWCEIDPFCQKVLKHHFPEATGHTDIKQTDFTQYANQIDILTGGFPCQPYSLAGKRKGKEDDRHLWPEMLRAIREIKPRWVVGENVYGLVNWDGGVVFDEVQSDLEAEGYEVWTVILPAAAVNAPHRRDRIWIIAHAKQDGRGTWIKREHDNNGEREICEDITDNGNEIWGKFRDGSNDGTNTNPDSDGQQRFDCEHEIDTSEGREYVLNDLEQVDAENTKCDGCLCGEFSEGCTREREQREFSTGNNEWICRKEGINTYKYDKGLEGFTHKRETSGKGTERNKQPTGLFRTNWQNFPTESPICSGDDGIPDRLDGITFPKWRNESIKAYGNAIVPQVAYELFKVIQQIEQTK